MALGISTLTFAGVSLAPAGSWAAITVGSDLTLPAASTPENCLLSTPPCTRLPFAYHAGNAYPRMSPTKGVVTSFGIKSAAAESVTFRLGQFPGAGAGRGGGTGPTVLVPGPGVFSFPANLNVQAGDVVGFDGSSTQAVTGLPGGCGNTPTTGGYVLFNPPLTNGSVQQADSTNSCEVLVNAVIAPSNRFTIGKLKPRSGIGILGIKVPGPGQLSLSGKGARGRKTAKQAGATKLKIRPTGSAKRSLAATGRVTLKLKVIFAPVGGTPHAEKRKLTLQS
jgi:hypothetical protein